MPNKKITQLPVAASVQDGDLIEKVTIASGVSEQATIHQVARALGIFINGVNAGIPNIIVYPDGSIDFVGSQVQISVAGILTAPLGISAGGAAFGVNVNGTFFNDGWLFNDDGSGTIGGLGGFTVTALGVYTIGNLTFGPAGSKVTIASGANQRAGNAILAGGTKAVANTTVTANTMIQLTRKTAGGAVGDLTYTLNAGVGFTINSASGTDTSTVSYLLIEVV